MDLVTSNELKRLNIIEYNEKYDYNYKVNFWF